MNKINGADLIAIGFHEGKILGLALEVTATHYQDHSREQLLELMRTVKEKPETFLDDEILEELATKIIEEANAPVDDTIQLKQTELLWCMVLIILMKVPVNR